MNGVDLSGFDADTTPDAGGFDPIPEGDYEAVISGSEEKPTKAGTGSYLKLEFTIISGEYERRKLWVQLNLNNPNEDAVRIARGELKRICHAVGKPRPTSSLDLHDIPLLIKVGLKRRDKNDPTSDLQNVIKSYKAKAAAPAKSATPAGVGAGQGSAPWARK